MHLLLGRIFCLLAILSVARADSSTPSSLIAELPSCALSCLVSGLSHSSCAATDIVCQCADTSFNNEVESCVLGNCTISQALTAKNITSTLCGIQPRDHSHVIGVVGLTGGTLATVAVLLRCISRYKSLGGGFWWDDWTIIFTAVLMIPFTALSYIASIGRLGKDIWAIPLNDIIIFFHQFYFAEILYSATLALTKTSILFFYLRIFPGVRFRQVTWCLIVISIMAAIAFVLVDAFQCSPANHYWRQWNGEPGRCFSPSGPAWSISIVGIIIDFGMLGLPLYQIRELNLPWRKRVTGCLMFSVGFFVTIVSILRLQSLVHFRNTTNPTYDYYSIGYWSIVEVNIGLICACIPSIRVLSCFVYSRLIGRSEDHSAFYSSGQPPAIARLDRDTIGIQRTKSYSYSIECNTKPSRDRPKFVHLVDISGPASNKSETSVV
ncbi:hypothetical protein OIDMADRAFT_168942 [Oidiodendron maius Zn]|uniref:CFEM domain-containing protein n=1 Tax=Oidiodendron maius (strain Zn) TaxID=913774 RepID=A0A0C3H1G2_OIDMZ|nr:hypothetical protein OIDMADRAFT_168942 [Oidiodendron maius Zn]